MNALCANNGSVIQNYKKFYYVNIKFKVMYFEENEIKMLS